MKRIFLLTLITIAFFTSCTGDDPFRITSTSVGPLTQETKVSELETVFANDSISRNSINGARSETDAIEVYDKEGNQLLSLMPAEGGSSSKIGTVQIFDSRYETEEGISLNSTFKDIQEAYTISRIETLLSTVVIFVEELDAYFTIDKKELPSELQFDRTAKVEAVQIPESAEIKYFMIGW